MIRKILFIFLFLSYTLTSKAIHTEDIANYPANKGWFMGAHIGTQYYFSEFNFHRYASIGYGFSSNAEGYVGKWISPLLAIRGNVSFNNVTSGEVVEQKKPKKPKIVTESFRMIHTGIDLIIDLRYLIKGRKYNYSFKPLMGVGYAFNTTKSTNGLAISFGGINTWKINDRLNVNLETKLRLLEDKVDGYIDRDDTQFVINAGLSYSF